MPLRKFLGLVCPIAAMTCLAVGYAMLGQGLGLLGVLLALLAWLINWRWPSQWLPGAALALTVGLSAAGLIAGAASVLMLLSTSLALAAWDLALFGSDQAGVSAVDLNSSLSHSHYEGLALALGLGLLAAVAGPLLRLQFPFGVMAFLVLLAFISLERLWRSLGG